ncbi:MAG: orotate phosphoribosyltransferase [Thermoguttaceae bacterium]
MYDKQALIALVRQKALKFGQFTLASGRKATYYLDGKQVTLDPAGAKLVAEGLLDLLAAGKMPDAVGGMSIGADPITAAVVTMSAVRNTPLLGFMVRKEPKGHGTNRYLEGPVQPGQTAVIVEDVVTTGGSSLVAIERAESFGLKIAGVLAIIDRMEGGAQAFAQRGYRFASLLSIRDFGIEPPAV